VVPCALTLGWGVMFGAILTAFVFPCLLAIRDDFVNFFWGEKGLYITEPETITAAYGHTGTDKKFGWGLGKFQNMPAEWAPPAKSTDRLGKTEAG